MNTYKIYRYSYCCTSPANRYQLTATIQAKSIRAAKLMFSKIWSGAGYITDENDNELTRRFKEGNRLFWNY